MSETHQAYQPVTQDEIDAWLESDGIHLSRYHARRLIVDLEAAKLREATLRESLNALAERDRATVQAVIEFMDKQLCVSDFDIERIRREFGLTKP